VPYTPEELALLKSSVPAPATNASGQKKSDNELPGGSALLVAERKIIFPPGITPRPRPITARFCRATRTIRRRWPIWRRLNCRRTSSPTPRRTSPPRSQKPRTTPLTFRRLVISNSASRNMTRRGCVEPRGEAGSGESLIQNYLGVTLGQKGLRTQAETALRKAIELNPTTATRTTISP